MKELHPKVQKILDISKNSKRKTLTGKPKDEVEIYSMKSKSFSKDLPGTSYYLPKN